MISNLFQLQRIVLWPAYLLIFLMLVYPMVDALLYVKVFLFLIIIAVVVLLMMNTGQMGLHPKVALWTFSLATLGFLFVLKGFFAGAFGAGDVVKLYAIYPIVYALTIAGIRSEKILSGLTQVFLFSTAFIALYSIVYTLTQTGILPASLADAISFHWDPQEFDLNAETGFIHMQYPGLNSLPFLVPFLMSASVTLLPNAKRGGFFKQVWIWGGLLLSMISVVLSGRRALYLVTLTTPFLVMTFVAFQPGAERLLNRKNLIRMTVSGVAAIVVFIGCLNLLYGVSFNGLSDKFAEGFSFTAGTTDTGAAYRRDQYHALLSGWMEDPILGAGHGVSAYGSIRSPLQPWSYELSYMALLYQTGLLGFAAYAAGIGWIYWMGIKVIRRGGYLSALMVACLVGMSSMLLANATNPYIDRFDGIWVIFFPLALVNYSLLKENRNQQLIFA